MYYINVYNASGKVVFTAPFINVSFHFNRAHYEHNLDRPDYAVFQSKDLAEADAEKRK